MDHEALSQLEPVPGTAVLRRLIPPPAPPGPDAEDERHARAALAEARRVAAQRLAVCLPVVFGLRSARHIAGREFGHQVRIHAAAMRATAGAATNVRVASLHVRLGAGWRRAAPGSYEIFGSVFAGPRPRAYSARLDGACLSLLRVA